MFVYLYRWEWNRALISGVIFLAAEVAVIGWFLNSRVSDLGHRVDEMRTGGSPATSTTLATRRRRPSSGCGPTTASACSCRS